MRDSGHIEARPNRLTPERLRFLHSDLGFSRDDLDRITGGPRGLIEALLERHGIQRSDTAYLLAADDVRGIARRLGCVLPAAGSASDLCSHLRQHVRTLARHHRLDWTVVDDLAAEHPRARR